MRWVHVRTSGDLCLTPPQESLMRGAVAGGRLNGEAPGRKGATLVGTGGESVMIQCGKERNHSIASPYVFLWCYTQPKGGRFRTPLIRTIQSTGQHASLRKRT